LYFDSGAYKAVRADYRITALLKRIDIASAGFAMGHTRLITNGQADNQPVIRDDLAIIHNGIITNDAEYWASSKLQRLFSIDTEALLGVAVEELANQGGLVAELFSRTVTLLKGSFSCALLVPKKGQLVLMSNTGSLHVGARYGAIYFASERSFLELLGCADIRQIVGIEVFEVPSSSVGIDVRDDKVHRNDLIPAVGRYSREAQQLLNPAPRLRRCSKCILPETMPFIEFDSLGVCNYCNNYTLKNAPRPRASLEQLLSKYTDMTRGRCIMPFSGGRDSSFALHLMKTEFGLKPVTMTYDWGMVTDLARRNIYRMCGELGVENILIADDIERKRRNIRLNLTAWLKKPELGMINILMAGQKHFFRHIESVKRETGVPLNIWGMNPLEVTHFKAGFLGFPPDFATKQVFYTGLSGQLRYQALRLKAMVGNPAYLNRSMWDTFSGEYYRSVKKKTHFYNLFDFWRWDEVEIDSAIERYGWEKAVDTNSTWRIGDGTAAFYNYVYHTMAGFTENDTFRSNQIREGQLTRERALQLIADENRPRYQNIKWYLDAVHMDFSSVIRVVNNADRLY
jgi:hypothetical protein